MIKYRKGKGVTDKWGKKPYAPNNTFVTRMTENNGQPARFTNYVGPGNIETLLKSLKSSDWDEIRVIEPDNTQWTITRKG